MMPKLSIYFIRAALLHLGIGFSIGALLLANKGFPFSAEIWHLLESYVQILVFGWMLQLRWAWLSMLCRASAIPKRVMVMSVWPG